MDQVGKLFIRKLGSISILLSLGLFAVGCSSDSAQSRFVLAEKLWTDGSYGPAALEFERIYLNDPNGALGQKALYRSALTHLLYLDDPNVALDKLGQFLKVSTDVNRKWDARKWIGEVLYSRVQRFDQAILHYKRMLEERPKCAERNEFHFRIAKSYFRLWKFEEALGEFQKLSQSKPVDSWVRKSYLEMGNVYVTAGEQQLEGSGPYREAQSAFLSYLSQFPEGPEAGEAYLGLALANEELDQLDAALESLDKAQLLYPVPQVIEIKRARILKRKAKKLR